AQRQVGPHQGKAGRISDQCPRKSRSLERLFAVRYILAAMSRTMPSFDPRLVPQVAPSGEVRLLKAVAPQLLTAPALRQRFAHPPPWVPELRSEPRFTEREPAQAAVLMPVVMRER